MGRLLGTAMSLDGDRIRVSINCSKLASRLLNICSISIQVDGGIEYMPIKYATASITVLTEGTALLPLYTTPGTTVTVQNVDTGDILFSGYVTQNNFSQPLTSDTITIECVDKLGYTKFLPVPDIALWQSNTVYSWVVGFADIAGIKDVRFEKAAKVRRRSDGKMTDRYYLLSFPAEYFLTSTEPVVRGDGFPTYSGVKMTIYDALTMIAESFRMTFIQKGNTLKLEEPASSAYIKTYTTNDGSEISVSSSLLTIDDDSYATEDNTVTSLQQYTLFSLTHKDTEERSVCHPIFDDRYLTPSKKRSEDISGEDTVVSYTLSSSLVEVLEANTTSNDNASFVGWKSFSTPDKENVSEVYESSWNKALRLRSDTMAKMLFTISSAVPRTITPSLCKGLKIVLELQITDYINSQYPKDLLELQYGAVYTKLKIGEYYYNGSEWTTNEEDFVLSVTNDGRTYIYGEELIPYPPLSDGRAAIELSMGKEVHSKVTYITKIDILEVPLPSVRMIERVEKKNNIEYLGEFAESKEFPSVELPIDLFYIMSDKSFGTIIDGVDYASGDQAVGAELLFGDGNMTMIEKIRDMATVGDGLQFDLSLVDDHNKVELFQNATGAIFENRKRVSGYEKDVLNNTIKVTLI